MWRKIFLSQRPSGDILFYRRFLKEKYKWAVIDFVAEEELKLRTLMFLFFGILE